MEVLSPTKYYLQLYELVLAHADDITAKKTVEIVEGMIEQRLDQKLRGIAAENEMNILALKRKQELDLIELKNNNLNRIIRRNQKILFGLFIVLELLILGLYFII